MAIRHDRRPASVNNRSLKLFVFDGLRRAGIQRAAEIVKKNELARRVEGGGRGVDGGSVGLGGTGRGGRNSLSAPLSSGFVERRCYMNLCDDAGLFVPVLTLCVTRHGSCHPWEAQDGWEGGKGGKQGPSKLFHGVLRRGQSLRPASGPGQPC
ncbi:hypothetical protein E2C01_056260 [Portunus trituberculatus]|uniref:Uncharacterized protein n=1 Tax=Portunus trituberculatus TaxID=210409 RepID=A0A5B7GYG5_PORTR|nr:hypothetical protein [Portunus trituberculatus]